MLFLNQANSGGGNHSCSSFSIRRSPKVQPSSENHAGAAGVKGTEAKCFPPNNMACEKNNTSSNSDEGNRGDEKASTMVMAMDNNQKNPPLQHNIPTVAIVTQAIASLANETEPSDRTNYNIVGNVKTTSLAKESNVLSCEELTESSYDSGDVPDLVDEDIFVDKDSTHSLPVVTPRIPSSSLDFQESPPLLPLTNQCKLPVVIKSSLRVSKRLSLKGRPSTERRVRGLWSSTINYDCHWYKLRDETVVHILGFLNLAGKLKVGMLANRYRSLVHSDKALWVNVDATEFVHTAHTNFSISSPSLSAAQARTGKALEDVLRPHNPVSLTIRDIHDRLSADSYLPNVASLQELTLSHFENLSDTHVHVLLLITHAGSKKKPNPLRRLSLNHCPLLTNASLRSVASQCAFLESLNLQGCTSITQLDSLANLLATETKPVSYQTTNHITQAVSTTPTNPLFKMFAPPPPPSLAPPPSSKLADMFSNTKPANGSPKHASIFSKNMFAPPASQSETTSSPKSRSKARCPTNPLQSLFAPPGMSPERKTPAMVHGMPMSSQAPMPPIFASGTLFGGKLQELDLRGTGVHPSALLKLFFTASDNHTLQISLRCLWLDGNQWTDPQFDQLGTLLASKDLKLLSLACTNHSLPPSSGCMTDTTLNRWAERLRFSQLTELNLSGHHKITGQGLANLLQQTPKLESLICRGTVNVFKSTISSSSVATTTSLMKRLGMLGKKHSLRVVDVRDCDLDAPSLQLIQSHLLDGKSPITVLF